jgi:thiol-disulfide isomerase/thioredoxin
MIDYLELQNAKELKEEIESNSLLLVYFYTESCKWCKVLEPVLEKAFQTLISGGFDEDLKRVRFIKVDASKDPDFTKDYTIFGVPTIVSFNNSVEIERLVGGDHDFSAVLDFAKKIINK